MFLRETIISSVGYVIWRKKRDDLVYNYFYFNVNIGLETQITTISQFYEN